MTNGLGNADTDNGNAGAMASAGDRGLAAGDVSQCSAGGHRHGNGGAVAGGVTTIDAWGRLRRVASLEDRFFRHVSPCPITGCWWWAGACNPAGYGHMVDEFPSRKKVRATRVSYEIHFGPSLRTLHVMHKCDQPTCVNPSHLVLGTQSENMRDKVSKGRDRSPVFRGEDHGMSKLRADDVLVIRDSVGPLSEMADRYGVTQALVSMIRKRKIWRHLP